MDRARTVVRWQDGPRRRRLAGKPRDERHPDRHHRAGTLSALLFRRRHAGQDASGIGGSDARRGIRSGVPGLLPARVRKKRRRTWLVALRRTYRRSHERNP
ncbi:hypothetical protein G6F59_017567 [Rhizopus arrhizus]|nr:hypothetical protein G6F59_017567 [Rhizopus arrhizus]